jgi:hypothetical protein
VVLKKSRGVSQRVEELTWCPLSKNQGKGRHCDYQQRVCSDRQVGSRDAAQSPVISNCYQSSPNPGDSRNGGAPAPAWRLCDSADSHRGPDQVAASCILGCMRIPEQFSMNDADDAREVWRIGAATCIDSAVSSTGAVRRSSPATR